MRQIKQVKIDDREVEVYELKVKHVRQIIDDLLGGKTLDEVIDKWLGKACSLSLTEIEELYPSDIEKIYAAFEEVNSPFYRACKRVKLDQYLANFLKIISVNLTQVFADSSKPATVPASGNTGTDSSSMPAAPTSISNGKNS